MGKGESAEKIVRIADTKGLLKVGNSKQVFAPNIESPGVATGECAGGGAAEALAGGHRRGCSGPLGIGSRRACPGG